MALKVKIDLENHYKINDVSKDLSSFTFSSQLKDIT